MLHVQRSSQTPQGAHADPDRALYGAEFLALARLRHAGEPGEPGENGVHLGREARDDLVGAAQGEAGGAAPGGGASATAD